MITQSELKELLDYNPETGVFTWKVSNSNRVKAGASANCKKGGYIIIMVKSKAYRAHRLAWLYMYGVWPENQIDHINHNGLDNRIFNLRETTQQENCKNTSISKNNTSGYTGVSLFKDRNKWQAYIMVDRKKIHLGYFEKKDDAALARKAAEIKYGFHPNHGVLM